MRKNSKKKHGHPQLDTDVRKYFPQGVNDAEDLSGLSELALSLTAFLQRFTHFFVTSRSCVIVQACAFASGLFIARKRNLERVWECNAKELEYHQLHHFLSRSPWDDQALCRGIAMQALNHFEGRSDVGYVIDPTGIAKKGNCSVGVARHWLGVKGKVDNGQLGVVGSLVSGRDTVIVDKELYLPKEWVDDPKRCAKAKIPEEARVYRSTGQIFLDLVARADANGIKYSWLGGDAEFGKCRWLLEELHFMGKEYVLDIPKSFQVYDKNPKLRFKTRKKGKRGKQSKKLSLKPKQIRVEQLVAKADGRKWRKVTVRNATTSSLRFDVLHLQVWTKFKDGKPRLLHLIVRRDRTEKQTRLKYSLSNAPSITGTRVLAYLQSQRFWVEQSIKECKQQLGMSEYQVRRAWHHHLAMAFLLICSCWKRGSNRTGRCLC